MTNKNTAAHHQFPFTAVIGQDDLKLALMLCIVDPKIGGVLVRGERGCGKTTTIRGLSQLMEQADVDYPFINLPIGATADRVLGTLNLETLINDKIKRVEPGLLNQANHGVLYIDEVNLLDDYLTDLLLDASSSGGYHLERDNLSEWLESKFCLVGSMNPEEGSLRPQFLDRFGLCVDVLSPKESRIRRQIVNNRLKFDDDPVSLFSEYQNEEHELSQKLLTAKQQLSKITLSEELAEHISKICIEQNIEGLRADILTVRASKALASLNAEKEVTLDHINRVLPFILAHRSDNYSPPTPPKPDNEESEDKSPNDSTTSETNHQNNLERNPSSSENKNEQSPKNTNNEMVTLPAISSSQLLNDPRLKANNPSKGNDLTLSHLEVSGTNAKDQIDYTQTVKNYLTNDEFKIHLKERKPLKKAVITFLIDSSGSMIQNSAIQKVKGLISEYIDKKQRIQKYFSLVAISKGKAETIVSPTLDIKLLLHKLTTLPSGGKTNMLSGLKHVSEVFRHFKKNNKQEDYSTNLWIFTDGKFNVSQSDNKSPLSEAIDGYKKWLKFTNSKQVIDTENGFVKLGRARKFATGINAQYSLI